MFQNKKNRVVAKLQFVPIIRLIINDYYGRFKLYIVPEASVVFLATVMMDGDVTRRLDNVCGSESAVHVRSAAAVASPLTVVVVVVGNGTTLTPVLWYVASANESKTFRLVVLFFLPSLSSSSSSSLNNKPAERFPDVRCCVLCRLKSWRLDTFCPPPPCDDGSYDVISALLFGRRPSQSSVVVFLVVVDDAGLRTSLFLRKADV